MTKGQKVKAVRRIVRAKQGETFDLELSEDLLRANEELAKQNKQLLEEHGTRAIDIMGSIGTGKTSIVSELVKRLRDRHRIAAIAGDLTTTIDADLIANQGAEVVQINTGKECHLDANLVRKALDRMDLSKVDILFIENVGNLICPVEFPLGSEKRVVVISVTEGPNIIVKHPHVFMAADVVVINKMDVAEVLESDVPRLERQVREINPGSAIIRTSCRTGLGIPDLIRALEL